jgi:exodeoxyribonuclease VII large subunit
MQEAISLYQFNQYVKQVISVNFDEPVWVRCELASVRHNKGHVYLELVENNAVSQQVVAQMSAVIWAGDYLRISGKLENQASQVLKTGAEVQLLVDLSYHERYGLKMNVRDVDVYFTLGKMEMLRRDILLRLQREERVDRNKAWTLPLVVQRIAVISSPTAAGYHDFMAHIDQNPFGYALASTLFPSSMQGEQVARDITRHLRGMKKSDFDAVVIIRGGGSKLDLADFDSYELGLAISECPIPVLTGIGHEIDVSIADMIAHTSCKTPTAVADFLLTRMRNFDQSLGVMAADLYRLTHHTLDRASRRISQWEQDLHWQAKHILLRQTDWLQQMAFQIKTAAYRQLDVEQEKMQQFAKSLELLDYTKVLARGFSITADLEGQVLRSVKGLSTGDELRITLTDGTLHTIIKDIKAHA